MGSRLLRRVLKLALLIVCVSPVACAQSDELPGVPAPSAMNSSAGPQFHESAVIQLRRNSFARPLSVRQKFARAYRRIVSPQMPLKAFVVSGFELAAGTGPGFPRNGWGAFGQRMGYNALSISTTTFFAAAFVPALVHQDPRYHPLHNGSIKTRVIWALRSEFVGFGDDGHAMPNYGNLAGLGLSAILANAYLPHSSDGVGNTVEAYGIKLGAGAGLNVVREFGAFHRLKAFVRHSKIAWK